MKLELLTAGTGCKKCQRGKEVVKELHEELEFEWEEVDIMDNPEVAQRYDLVVSPGIVVDGELIDSGVVDKEWLKEVLDEG